MVGASSARFMPRTPLGATEEERSPTTYMTMPRKRLTVDENPLCAYKGQRSTCCMIMYTIIYTDDGLLEFQHSLSKKKICVHRMFVPLSQYLEDPRPVCNRAVNPCAVHSAVVRAELVHALPGLLVGYPGTAIDVPGCLDNSGIVSGCTGKRAGAWRTTKPESHKKQKAARNGRAELLRAVLQNIAERMRVTHEKLRDIHLKHRYSR